MRVITGEKNIIKCWAGEIEEDAERQLRNVANLPFIHKWVAAMPDCHYGKGATVGSVIALENAIIPAAVGVDSACGMMATKFNFKANAFKKDLTELRHSIERSIPVGHNSNTKVTNRVQKAWNQLNEKNTIPYSNYDSKSNIATSFSNAINQLGSLGSGNHFIEICLDKEDNVWAMLHSGSRNIGKTIAEYHIKKAKELMHKFHIFLTDEDLAYLPKGTPEFDNYWNDLQWCQNYAYANREEMMLRVIKDVSYFVYGIEKLPMYLTDFQVHNHHNFVALENHYDKNIYVTRKGATSARLGEWGIIPGSMGTRSYIVQGKGNPESFMSCSHGAGRIMSRSKAKKTFTKEDIEKQTAGIICRKDEGILDELPGAYKNIDEIMENQKDLVTPVYELKQLICIKG